MTIFFINYICFKREIGFPLRLGPTVVKPLLACAVMGVTSYYGQKLLAGIMSDAVATAVTICLAAGLYGLVMLLIGGIGEKDILMLPKGRAIARLLKKLHLLREKPRR